MRGKIVFKTLIICFFVLCLTIAAYAERLQHGEQLQHGSIITLKCLAKTGELIWLDSRTHEGKVGMRESTRYSGTRWEVFEVDEGVYAFKSLGKGKEKVRWLDGRTDRGTVILRESADYTGTRWKVFELEAGIYAFKSLGAKGESRWLDGKPQDGTVGLVESTSHRSGTKWEIHVE